ncbi:MAG: serine/threonine-protein kinase [Planctomycetota bacterium]
MNKLAAQKNRIFEKSFSDAIDAVIDGKPVDWETFGTVKRKHPGALDALRVIESIRNLYGGVAQPGSLVNSGAQAERLQIREEIGAGSFGKVYKAFDTILSREVAVKIVKSSGGLAEPWMAEVQALARVQHPNVVTIHNVSKRDGSVFIEMELVAGERINDTLQKHGPFAPAGALKITNELCGALAAVHAEGIVHGDVKPANVMRRRDGRAVLLDFGLARAITAGTVRYFKSRRGTPITMAPEQMIEGENAGPRADLYSLTVVLYWMLTGRYPHEAESMEEFRERVLEHAPVPITRYKKNLNPDIVNIIEKGLARHARDRFETAEKYQKALQAALKFEERENEPTVCGVNLFVKRGGSDVRLQSGSEVRIGERVYLDVTVDRDVSFYVFNESRSGELFLLFPIPGIDMKNPVAAGTHRIPGSRDGKAKYWTVTSDGGGEERIFAVATRRPIAEIDKLVKRSRAASESTEMMYPKVAGTAREALMRGIGGLGEDDDSEPVYTNRRGRLHQLSDELDRGAAESKTVWKRLIILKNAGA